MKDELLFGSRNSPSEYQNSDQQPKKPCFSPIFPSQQTPTEILTHSPLSPSARMGSVCTQTPALNTSPCCLYTVIEALGPWSRLPLLFLHARKLNYTHTGRCSPLSPSHHAPVLRWRDLEIDIEFDAATKGARACFLGLDCPPGTSSITHLESLN